MHRTSGEAFSLRRFPQKCPFCPVQSQRLFDEIGLFQHAIATSKYNSKTEMVRAHSTLLNDLRKVLNMKPAPHISSLVQPPAPARDGILRTPNISSPVQPPAPVTDSQQPKEEQSSLNPSARGKDGLVFNPSSKVKVVWPWMGIVMKVDYKQVTTNNIKSNGKDCIDNVNPSNNAWKIDLKGQFSCFNTRGVHALGNQGLAVLDFGQDLLGCFDAEDFARGFSQCGRGKLEFQKKERLRTNHVQEMFGWIADENDYNQMNAVGEFLRKRGTLRAMPRLSHAWSEQHDQLFQGMRSKLQDKNFKLIELKREVCKLQTLVCKAENQKDSAEMQLSIKELKHKQEMERIRKDADKAIQESKEAFLNEKEKLISLQAELMDFKKKVQLLEEKSTHVTSDETLLKQLIDTVEEKEVLEIDLQNLTCKEREANDKVQNAMKAATEVLLTKGNDQKSIGLKDLGALNNEPWTKVCAVKFKDEKEGWETPCKMLISNWDDYLRDTSWYPYKLVRIEGEGFEEVIDANDDKLSKLRREFGSEVYMTVVDALNELREWNPSGRYPIRVPWNYEMGRAAQLDEIIRYLADDGPKRKRLAVFEP